MRGVDIALLTTRLEREDNAAGGTAGKSEKGVTYARKKGKTERSVV